MGTEPMNRVVSRWTLMARRWMAGVAFCLCAASLAADPAAASGRIYSAVSGPELAALMEDNGVDATVTADEYGDPVIHGAIGALNFRVWPHDCEGAPRRCRRLDFSAGFKTDQPVDMAHLDAFNETWVFGKAYLGDDGTAYVDFPMNLTAGVTEANLADNIALWSDIVRMFAEHIGWYEGS